MRAEGIGRQLDPSINLLRTALPHLIRATVGATLVPLLHPCRAGACARKCTPPAQARTLPATRGQAHAATDSYDGTLRTQWRRSSHGRQLRDGPRLLGVPVG